MSESRAYRGSKAEKSLVRRRSTDRAKCFTGLALAATMVLAGAAGLARGQAGNRPVTKFYPDFSDTADALLRNAAGHARDRQWAAAIELYQRVIQQYGDKVARLPRDEAGVDPSGESVLYVDLRRFCQGRLAALPVEGRALYRSRVDAQAELWFRQGEAGRDRSALRRVVDQSFCSGWGDDALDLLGDLAFQDGRFEEAVAAYRQLVADPSGGGPGLIHPDPSVDLARVAGKLLLCRAALGEGPPTAADLAAYGRSYPGAAGALAGRDGPYLETLTAALRGDRLAPPAQPDGRWPTFAGSPTRSRVVNSPVDVGSLQWRAELKPVGGDRVLRGLPRGFGGGGVGGGGGSSPDRLLAYHPIVLGDQAVICDDAQILGFDLNDRPADTPGATPGLARPAWRHDEEQAGGGPMATRLTYGVPRYTLTAFGDRIYARMGVNSLITQGPMSAGSLSYVVAVDRSTDGKLLWKRPSGEVLPARRPGEPAARRVGFEGSPVADARGVYVALTDRREQTSTYVACLDAETGATRWVRYLGAASSDADNMFGMGMGMGGMGGGPTNDFGHRLLTLDGPTVYYQTNLGAVAALDAETGAVRWVATYPRQDRLAGSGHDRDLNPAVVHDGLVIVAPDDAQAVYAFEAVGGRFLWKTDPLPDEVKLTHLLGVAKGKLVATGDRVMLFDVKTGKLAHSWPDTGHGFKGYGRGVLADDKIYWPTRTEIHVLDQSSGLRSEPPIKLQETYQEAGGNLAVGDGYLLVAQADKLVVFCQNRRLIQRYQEEIVRSPGQAGPYYRLAKAAEATGQDELALGGLADALRLARPSELVDGQPLADTARDNQFRLLMRLGEKARAAGDPSAAEARFRSASAAARVDRDRLRARLAEAEARVDRGDAVAAVETLQRLLAEGGLRSLDVAAEGGRRSIRADLLIGDRLAGLVRDHGRAAYAPYDRAAAELLSKGLAAGDPRQVEEVALSYPVAEVVPDSLLALGRLYDARRQPGQAARAYKRLLSAAPGDGLRARAALGLARAFEAQRLWVPARDAYAQALARFPGVALGDEESGTEATLGPLAAARLARPPFDRMTADRAEPALPVPLARRWSRPLESPSRPLAATGVPPSAEAGRVFVTRGGEVRPVDGATGASRWSAELGGVPVWVGYLDDRVLAATETRVVALGLETGEALWRFEAVAPADARPAAEPFAPAGAPGPRPSAESPAGLHGFRVVGSRLFCLRGGREILALDGDSGLVDWSYATAAGPINPHILVGPERVVAQTQRPDAGPASKPETLLVLDTATGHRRGEFPQTEGEAWPRPPLPLDDDRVVVVPDRRSVALLDLTRGVNSWVFRESKEMPKNGPPRVFGDAERLLLVQDGDELIRLDAATGVKRWSRPLGSEDLGERPEALAMDGRRVYWVSGQALSAANLGDGALAWSKHLAGPESGWAVDLTSRCVLAYPGLPRRAEGESEGLPLVFCRRDDGGLVQRLLFPVPASEAVVRLAPGGAVVATPAGLWALGERRAVDGPGAGR